MQQKMFFIIAGIYSIAVAYILFDNIGEGNEPSTAMDITMVIIGALFLGWNIAPQFLLLIFKDTLRSKLLKWLFILAQAGLSSFVLYALYDAFYVNPDAQNGILFIVIPFVLGFSLMIVGGILKGIDLFISAKNLP